ncbi:hypothetical protein ACFWPK_21485 [Nocardia sp. NPDC058519]|uniref:hypothetical protein n=1 Tax=Nocardia sp. NPDC058519 TaxID=3346535 RepID=UPI00365D7DEF
MSTFSRLGPRRATDAGTGSRLRPAPTSLAAFIFTAALIYPLAPTASAAPSAPPGLGPDGTATVHGDAYSTDTVPGSGPGPAPDITGRQTFASCSSVFVGNDGMPVALCTAPIATEPPELLAPTVKLFDPTTGGELASVQLDKGALLGGVYGYLDNRNRVIVADGNHTLLAVGHSQGEDGRWRMDVEPLASLNAAIPAGDNPTGLAPTWDGQIWFVTTGGIVGTVRPGTPGSAAQIRTLSLEPGEQITNGTTMRPGGASVITSRALYEIDLDTDGTPTVRWRRGYDVGPARKPGLLAHGSGTTPTYFAVDNSGTPDDLVAITDDAPKPDLIVYRRTDGAEVCRLSAFATTEDPSSVAPDGVLIDGPAATENSIIAHDGALVLVNTYGYEYPSFAVDSPSTPASAPYQGGATRVDVRVAGDGTTTCQRVWTNRDRTASLPKLTRDDDLIHTLSYGPIAGNPVQKLGPVYYTATSLETGREVQRDFIGMAPLDEPMELTGTLVAGEGGRAVMWQPTVTRLLRIAPNDTAGQ